MPVHNQEIGEILSEIADLLEIQGANPFRIRAYRNAVRTIDDLGKSIQGMLEEEIDLTSIDGIGKGLAGEIQDIVSSGASTTLKELHKEVPAGITDLLRIPGLGPKRVKLLYNDLGISTLTKLEKAAQAGQLRELPGLGEKIEKQIIASIARGADSERRTMRASAMPYVQSLTEYLGAIPGLKKLTVAGSYRRSRETVGDLDFLVTASAKSPVMDTFVQYDEVKQVLAKGKTKSSVVLRSGIQVDLRLVEAKSYGAALHYFTGSQAHNVAVRKLGQKKGLKINEYGVFKGDEWLAGKTEEDVFAAVDLKYIEPELREARGELDASNEDALPSLVKASDIKGDLHMHTTYSDGANTIKEMAEAAAGRGYEYIAITDHSKRLTVANGLDEDRLRKQVDEIDEVNEKLKDIAVLKGIEVDILEDGSLDLSDDVLTLLDVVIGSVHSKFNLSREKQTERLRRAIGHPLMTMIGHPSGRLLLTREPYDADIPRLIEYAAEAGCFLELNANPQRLDLNDVHCHLAKDAGVIIGINTDAHRIADYDNIAHGVGQARRGWLEKRDILNTRTLKQLRKLL